MPELTGAADFEARLAEIDRRLADIQSELAPSAAAASSAGAAESEAHDRRPPPDPQLQPEAEPEAPPQPAAPPEPQPQPSALPAAELAALNDLHQRLAASISELLSGYEAALRRLAGAPSPSDGPISIDAGPFSGIDAVHEFERALATLSGVANVTVAGFEGADRAIFDVQLEGPEA